VVSPSTRRHSIGRLCAFGLALGCAILEAAAQLPLPRLHWLSPAGGRAGSQVEVNLGGADLDDATELRFSHEGISGRAKLDAAGLPEGSRFTVSIASNVPPGLYEARALGRFGLSSPRRFAVGRGAELTESGTNRSAASAFPVSPGAVVNATADADAVDFFQFTAQRGERWFIEAQARALDSRMDPALMVLDGAGRELERARRGGLIDFTAPADGVFTVKAHDALYRGGAEFFYRLSVSRGPRVDFVFPPAGEPGTKGRFAVYGRNLPGSRTPGWSVAGKALERLEVEIELPATEAAGASALVSRPATLGLRGFDYALPTTGGPANAVFLGLASATVVPEQEPNNASTNAQKISPPCEVAGQFLPRHDADWFEFEAKKGEVFRLEVVSERAGPVTDAMLVALFGKEEVGEFGDAEGNHGGPAFNFTTRDPAGRLEAKEDGTFRVQARDSFNTVEDDPRRVYRLLVRRETPDFDLVALPHGYAPQIKDKKDLAVAPAVARRGETVVARVLAMRRDGFDGAIQLGVEELPQGVRCPGAVMNAGSREALLYFTVDEDAPEWAGTVRITGRAKAGERELVREARGGTLLWPVGDPGEEAVASRLTGGFAFSVVTAERAPIIVRAAENKVWEGTAGTGKLAIPLRVSRSGEFKEALKLKATGLGALDSLKELDVDAKATNAVLEIDLAQQKIPAGEHRFVLIAQTKGQHRRVSPDEEKAAQETAKEFAKAADELAAAAKKATEKLEAVKASAEATAEAKADAEKEAASGASAAQEASAKKDALARRAKELAERAKPKETTIVVYSEPIRLRITEAPKTAAK
jgi:hypothetical protein